jgi:hypothetical protein
MSPIHPENEEFAKKITNILYPRREAYLKQITAKKEEFENELRERKTNNPEGE